VHRLDPSKLTAISVTMGHATTRTTEEHYGRMKETKALEEVKALWIEKESPKFNPPLIDKKFNHTGYA
jgi:hypothetical protein